jgi:hypothetical protein
MRLTRGRSEPGMRRVMFVVRFVVSRERGVHRAMLDPWGGGGATGRAVSMQNRPNTHGMPGRTSCPVARWLRALAHHFQTRVDRTAWCTVLADGTKEQGHSAPLRGPRNRKRGSLLSAEEVRAGRTVDPAHTASSVGRERSISRTPQVGCRSCRS